MYNPRSVVCDSAMVVYGLLTYRDGYVSIPNQELMNSFEDAEERDCAGVCEPSDKGMSGKTRAQRDMWILYFILKILARTV